MELVAWTALAYVAAQGIDFGADLNAARRRAVLLLATGGDPRRGLDLDGRAVTALASDLDASSRRQLLERRLIALREEAEPFPQVRDALDTLLANSELAWRALAAALIAEDLEDDG